MARRKTSDEKDLVYWPDPKFSIEIKTLLQQIADFRKQELRSSRHDRLEKEQKWLLSCRQFRKIHGSR